MIKLKSLIVMIKTGQAVFVNRFLLISFLILHQCNPGLLFANSNHENLIIAPQEFSVSQCNLSFQIPDNSCTTASNFTIPVNGISQSILGQDIVLKEVKLIIDHTATGDLDIRLISPFGQAVEISSNNGSSANHYGDPNDSTCEISTTFSMDACQDITSGQAPFIGSYIPEESLNNFSDNSDANGNWLLKLCDDFNDDHGVLKYVELVFSRNSCPVPTNLIATNISDNSIELDWTSNTTCSDVIIEYGTPGFEPGVNGTANEGTAILVPCPVAFPILINGLSSSSNYEFYVRQTCSDTICSDNSCPILIQTPCATPAMTLEDNFDSELLCGTTCGSTCDLNNSNWFNTEGDDSNWLVEHYNTKTSNTGPSDDVTVGGNYLYVETSGSSCQDGKESILKSNCLMINSNTPECHLSFWYHMYGVNVNELKLEISNDAGATWLPLWSENGNQGDRWFQAFIDLTLFHTQTVQFRFIGITGSGSRGDIALDQIEFYGAQDLGFPINTYYRDADNDSFGTATDSLETCLSSPPSGYVSNSADCNDTDDSINPNSSESPCNGIDENCNGLADDLILPSLSTNVQTICVGDEAILSFPFTFTGDLYWFTSLSDTTPLHVGNDFNAGQLLQSSSFYVTDSIPGFCYSDRVLYQVNVLEKPDLQAVPDILICPGSSFDLSSINFIDANQLANTFTFHSGIPTNSANELPSTVVTPSIPTNLYVKAISSTGCYDEISMEIDFNEVPEVDILQGANLSVCAGTSFELEAVHTNGGIAPFSYLWNTNESNATLPLNADSIAGGSVAYVVTITDAAGCSSTDLTTATVNSNISSIGIDQVNQVSSCDGNDGSIALSPVNGQGPFEYHWEGAVSGSSTNNNGSYTINNLEQGAYRVTVSDNSIGDCELVIPIIIVNGPNAVVDSNVIVNNVICNGESNGSIDITVLGGNPTFEWSNEFITEDLTNVAAGNYSVTISEGGCESVLNGIIVEEPLPIEATILSTQTPTCPNGADGGIDLQITGGVGSYDFEWNNLTYQEDLSNVSSGIYSLTVEDQNNCPFFVDNLEIEEIPAITVTLEKANITCPGEADGFLELTTIGGTSPYSYNWSNSKQTPFNTDLDVGDYDVTIIDAKGCEEEFYDFTIDEPSPLISVETVNDATCNGLENGEISIAVQGGTFPYYFDWNINENTDTADSLGVGLYSVTVSDENGCENHLDSIDVNAPGDIDLSVNIIDNNCFGLEEGAIIVGAQGGTFPYSYDWSNEVSGPNNMDIAEGEYQVTVTDLNGCELVSNEIEVSLLAPLYNDIDFHQDITCNSFSNGQAFISLPNFNSPYDVRWNSGDQGAFLDDLPAGNYFATITDNVGCITFTDTIQINEPDSLLVDILDIEMPTCNGFDDANINVDITGGIYPYVYSWNNGSVDQNLTEVLSGQYELNVLDANGCNVSSGPITIEEPEVVEVQVVNAIPASCSGSDGSIDVEVIGGESPYSYEWNNDSLTQDLSSLNGGFFYLTVSDANGCIGLASAINVESGSGGLSIDTVDVNYAICNNEESGTASVEVFNGVWPYQYLWSNSVLDSVNADLPAGTYSLTVTDAVGCTGTIPMVEIIQAEEINIEIDQIENVSCYGMTDAFIEVTVSGGSNDFDYEWSNATNDEDAHSLGAGSYTLTVEDSYGCTNEILIPIVVTQPARLELDNFSIQDVDCADDEDGEIELVVTGGTGDLIINWDHGPQGAELNGLNGGSYYATVTDENDCSLVLPEIIVQEPEQALSIPVTSLSVMSDNSCVIDDGSISLAVEGGTQGYSYMWNNGDSTQNIQNLPAGFYQLTVVDANNCFTQSSLIEVPENLIYPEISINTSPEMEGTSLGTAAIEVLNSLENQIYEWDSTITQFQDSLASNLSAGNYSATVTNTNGCSTTQSFEIGFLTNTVFLDKISNLNIFPNPTEQLANLTIELKSSASVEIVLHDLSGKVLFSKDLGKAASFQNALDVGDLPSGLFLLHVFVDGQQESVIKLVKI